MQPRSAGAAAAAKWRTAVLICLACVVEGADMAVLPALYLYIARGLRASPAQLGVMTLCRALVQACASPIRCARPSGHQRPCQAAAPRGARCLLVGGLLFRSLAVLTRSKADCT